MVPATALAYVTYNGHTLIYGVGNYGASPQHYWIAASATGFENEIDMAMSRWIYTTSYWGITTPIYYTQTPLQGSSRMDVVQQSVHNPSWAATTNWFKAVGPANPAVENWSWGRITLSRPLK
jgi:hypothetical protein